MTKTEAELALRNRIQVQVDGEVNVGIIERIDGDIAEVRWSWPAEPRREIVTLNLA